MSENTEIFLKKLDKVLFIVWQFDVYYVRVQLTQIWDSMFFMAVPFHKIEMFSILCDSFYKPIPIPQINQYFNIFVNLYYYIFCIFVNCRISPRSLYEVVGVEQNLDCQHGFVKMEMETSAADDSRYLSGSKDLTDCWLVSLWCPAVCPPSCIPQRSVCACAAVCSWSWFRSWSRSLCSSVLQQDTVWIRTTVWSSAVPLPPCLDTQSCCIATELTTGLDLYCSSNIDMWLILCCSAIDPLFICYWSCTDLLVDPLFILYWYEHHISYFFGWQAMLSIKLYRHVVLISF